MCNRHVVIFIYNRDGVESDLMTVLLDRRRVRHVVVAAVLIK